MSIIKFNRRKYPFVSPMCEKCMNKRHVIVDWRSPNNEYMCKYHGKDDILLIYKNNIFDTDVKVVPMK